MVVLLGVLPARPVDDHATAVLDVLEGTEGLV
jgi:hypothetical protein